MKRHHIVFVGLAILCSCAQCPYDQASRSAALDVAKQYAIDSFQTNSQRSLAVSDLVVVSESYESADRYWSFHIASADGDCSMYVAVEDCGSMESMGGGACRITQLNADSDA
jgi:hypothetical protein